MYTHKYFQNVFDDYFCDDTKRKELKSKITDIQEEYTGSIIRKNLISEFDNLSETEKKSNVLDLAEDNLDYQFYTSIFDDTGSLNSYENMGIGVPHDKSFTPLNEVDKEPGQDSNRINRFKSRFRNDNGAKTKTHWEYIFVIYFWFHVFAEEKDEAEYNCLTSHACKLDKLFIELFPEKEGELFNLIIKIRDQYNRSSKPTKELFEKWVEIAKIKSEQDKSDINNIQKSDDNVSDKDSEREVSELTPEQRQEIVGQIIAFGKDGLVSSDFSFDKEETNSPILGDVYSTQERVEIECDGLDYNSKISLSGFILDFQTVGISLQEPQYNQTDNIEVSYYLRNSDLWEVTIEGKPDCPLKGNLLRASNGIMFYTAVNKEHDQPRIHVSRKVKKDQLNVTFTGKRTRDLNKEQYIEKLIEKELLKIFSEQIFEMFFHEDEEKNQEQRSADIELCQRQRVEETVDRVNDIQTSPTSNFIALFEKSGLPNDHFKGRELHGFDLSDSDLSALDLTDTKFIDCIIRNTIFPENFDIGSQCLKPKTDQDYDINENLIYACEKGDIDEVTKLIQASADVNNQTIDGTTPLMAAASNGKDSIVSLLYNHGALSEKFDMRGATALIRAVIMNHVSTAQLLLEHGANVNAADYTETTALMHAASRNHFHLVKIYIKSHYKTNFKSCYKSGLVLARNDVSFNLSVNQDV